MADKVTSSDFFSDRLHFIEITNNTLETAGEKVILRGSAR